eukprot:4090893-Alexandrium_andersonii.AAC.1
MPARLVYSAFDASRQNNFAAAIILETRDEVVELKKSLGEEPSALQEGQLAHPGQQARCCGARLPWH